MRCLELKHVLWLHRRLIESSGGALGIRDMATLQSAIAQPMMSVGGVDAELVRWLEAHVVMSGTET